LSPLNAFLGFLNSILYGIQNLLLAIVIDKNIIELEACQRIFWNSFDDVGNNIFILNKLLNLSSRLLSRHELELDLLIGVSRDHELDSLLIKLVFEFVVFV
jgi:hypothetical protein